MAVNCKWDERPRGERERPTDHHGEQRGGGGLELCRPCPSCEYGSFFFSFFLPFVWTFVIFIAGGIVVVCCCYCSWHNSQILLKPCHHGIPKRLAQWC